MKTADFNDLCHREYAQDKGCVVRLHLTRESYAEMLAEVLGGSGPFEGDGLPEGVCGARLDAMVNPATRTVVKVAPAAPFVPDHVVVAFGPDGHFRAVTADQQPVAPEPAPEGTPEPRDWPYRIG